MASLKPSSYSIVSFTKEDGVISVIPSSWLCDNNRKCFWPPFPAGPAIKKCKPAASTWNKVEVEVLEESIDTYARAHRHLKRAEEDQNLQTTDAETTCSRLRKKDKPKNRTPSLKLVAVSPIDDNHSSGSSVLSSYEPLADDEDDELLRRLDALKGGHSADEGTEDTGKEAETATESYFISQDEVKAIHERIDKLEKRQEASEKAILTQLAGIKADVKEILLWTKTNGSDDQIKQTNDKVPLDLPLNNPKQLQELEDWIFQEDNRTKLVKYCSTFGGSDMGKIVRKILSNLFTADLSKTINYIGANGKVEFRSLRLKSVVADAARCNVGKSNATDFEIEDIIKKWFQNSRDLNGGRTARKENTTLQ